VNVRRARKSIIEAIKNKAKEARSSAPDTASDSLEAPFYTIWEQTLDKLQKALYAPLKTAEYFAEEVHKRFEVSHLLLTVEHH
jgi:hypothetical protein